MDINSLDTLVSLIAKIEDKEEIKKAVVAYGNKREKKGIEDGWRRSRVLHRFAIKNRKEQLKKHLLDYNEEAGAIPLVEFLRYFSSLSDFIKDGVRAYKTKEIMDFADEIEGLMFSKLGGLKLDRRTLFSKDN